MLETARIGALAAMQLAAWEDLARGWALYEDEGFERCVSCCMGVIRLADDQGHPYRYTDDQRLVLTVAHLRQAHMNLDPDHG